MLKVYGPFEAQCVTLRYHSILVNYAAETFINAMRPFMGSMLDKYEVCGTRMAKCKPMLMKRIGSDQLPPKYGGTNKEWKPVPFN